MYEYIIITNRYILYIFIFNPWITYIYIYNIYLFIYLLLLLLLYNSSILNIEHSPCYIALGSTHTHKVI